MRWDVDEIRWERDEMRKNWRWQQELKLDETRWNKIQRDAFYSDEALTKWKYIWARCLSWIDDEYWT